MLLKKITICNDGTIDTDYIHLKSDFIVTTPDANGSFGKRSFGCSEEIPEPGVVAVLDWVHQENKPIFIFEDQEAFIIGNDGKTISIIHKQTIPDTSSSPYLKQIPAQKSIEEMVTVTWYRDRRQTSKTWRKWDDFAKTLDTRHLETVVVREDTDPNQPGSKLP